MKKYKVRLYYSTFVDVEVNAESESQAIEKAESDWSENFSTHEDEASDNVALQEGESEAMEI